MSIDLSPTSQTTSCIEVKLKFKYKMTNLIGLGDITLHFLFPGCSL